MSQLLLDREIQSEEEDLLETGKLADSVESIISLAGEETFSLALYGSWGTGKTSLLRILETRLKQKSNLVIWFDTWKYESQPNLVLPLLKKLYNEIPDEKKAVDCKEILKTSIASLSWLYVKHKFNIEADYKSLKDLISDHQSALGKFDDKIEKYSNNFKDFTTELFNKTEINRIIILFDDLDRCSPESMVSLIESVKLFLWEGKRITFIYALDKEVVAHAITNKYSKLKEFDGERYLEKVFDISLYLPPISPPKADIFLKELLNNIETFKLREPIKKFCQNSRVNTPRVIKKIVNKTQIMIAQKDEFNELDLRNLINNRAESYGILPQINRANIKNDYIKFEDIKLVGYITLSECFSNLRNYFRSSYGKRKLYEIIEILLLHQNRFSQIKLDVKKSVKLTSHLSQNYFKYSDDFDVFISKEFKEFFHLMYPPDNPNLSEENIFKVCIELEMYEEFLQSFGL